MNRLVPIGLARRPILVAALAVLALPAAGQDAPAPAPATAATAAAPAATPPALAAPGPRPFAAVVKDAKAARGFFTLWQKDDKTWIEVKPDQLDKPFYFGSVRTHGVGERSVIGGLMGPRHIVALRKVGTQVQLVALNQRFRAKPGSATERAVKSSFSDSLLASAPVASAPHPESKAILVEANALLLGDLAGGASTLEAAFRVPYSLDPRNSQLARAETNELSTGFQVMLHYAVPKLPVPPASPAPGAMLSTPPVNMPDARSLFLGYRYNFAQLPAPMPPRLADERVGFFTTGHVNFSDDLDPSPNVYHANRWRLEKKDPSAALSEPVKPIVYWLDRNIPEKHRKAVIDGILEWNKAFERIGFKDAVQAKVQPDDADFDTADLRFATVRWYLSSDAGPAIGPSQVDLRTGEILDADILMTDGFTRNARRVITDDVPHAHGLPGILGHEAALCTFAGDAQQEAEFALDLLEARGEIAPDSPEADAFVYAYVKQVITHEVGHTLGLRHNFRASTVYTAAQLRDPAFTKANGIVASVMDYAPFNIPLEGEARADYVHPGLGPYDFWAIEWGYKPIEPAMEKEELERIAARGANDPWLAYATDEDGMLGGGPQGQDPTVNQFDLSSEPLAFFRKRLALSRELWNRLQAKPLKPGESYDALRRSFQQGFTQLSRGLMPATKYIGGVVQLRDRAGTGRLPWQPVPASQQREALRLIADGVFAEGSFRFRPEFLASLPHSRLDAFDQRVRGQSVPAQPMISVSSTILGLQRSVLDQVMSDAVATRLVDAQDYVKDPKDAFRLAELYDSLQASIWSEAKSGRETTVARRNLQREHLRRVAGALVRPSASLPADARSLLRENARGLAADLRAAQSKPGLSKETRAHYAESIATLEDALKAPLQRSGV